MNCPVPSDDVSLVGAMYGNPEMRGLLDPETGEITQWQ